MKGQYLSGQPGAPLGTSAQSSGGPTPQERRPGQHRCSALSSQELEPVLAKYHKKLPRLLKLNKIQPEPQRIVIIFNLTLRAKFKRWQAIECGYEPQNNYIFLFGWCGSRAAIFPLNHNFL
jgi:hypothetical protein